MPHQLSRRHLCYLVGGPTVNMCLVLVHVVPDLVPKRRSEATLGKDPIIFPVPWPAIRNPHPKKDIAPLISNFLCRVPHTGGGGTHIHPLIPALGPVPSHSRMTLI